MRVLGRNKGTMKMENRCQILNLIRQNPISRVGLARKTRLTQSAIGNMVNDLLQLGLVLETESMPEENSLGRRPILLDLNPSWKTVAGISIDREGFTVGLWDLRGKAVGTCISLPYENDPVSALEKLSKTVKKLLSIHSLTEQDILGLGIIAPGPLQKDTGTILQPAHFEGWHNFPLQEAFSRKFPFPVYVEHNASAMARVLLDFGSPYRSFALLIVNDGIGLGLALNGKIYAGTNGLGCELGHTSIDLHGRPCTCGNRGCLEQYASTSAILYDAKRAMHSLNSWEELVNQAYEGNSFCQSLLEQQGEYLAASIINLHNLLELDAVLLAGAAAYRGEKLLGEIQKKVQQRVLLKQVHPLEFRLVQNQELPPSLAAASIVLDQFFQGDLFARIVREIS